MQSFYQATHIHLCSAVHMEPYRPSVFCSLLLCSQQKTEPQHTHTHTVLPYYTPAADQLLPHTVHPHPAIGGWYYHPKHTPASFSMLTEKPMSAALESALYQISEMSQNEFELKSMPSFPMIFRLLIPWNDFIEMQMRSRYSVTSLLFRSLVVWPWKHVFVWIPSAWQDRLWSRG